MASTIILSAGKINHGHLPVNGTQSNGMILVNSKPVIAWVLDDLLAKGIHSAFVVLRNGDRTLAEFLERTYSNRMRLELVAVDSPRTILHSLQAALRRTPGGLVRVILGDTLIQDPFDGHRDFVYTGEVEVSHRWCVVLADKKGRVLGYRDKVDLPGGAAHRALAGYYHFVDGAALKRAVGAALRAGEGQLSDVLTRYGSARPILARPAARWFDFGHIDRLVESQRRLLQSRFFNSLRVDPVLNTITKVSAYQDKLADELAWYRRLPPSLRMLTPRITRHRRRDGRLEIEMEYYGYPTLAGLFAYGNLNADMWQTILRHVLQIHARLCEHRGRLSRRAVRSMYDDKVRARLKALAAQGPEWRALLMAPTVRYNGAVLQGIPVLEGLLGRAADRLAAGAQVRVVHGDLCFSNILFDLNNLVARLIDPRGSFGVPGIYGDPRYDVAKLRHSATGLYDLILADLFELEKRPDGFHGRVFSTPAQRAAGKYLDAMLVEMGYSLPEIKLIEGLLFVSMIPLHRGHPARQKMMFLTGLARLNETLS